MKFTYETQGAITYLVCELEAGEQIDRLTLGMLSNNHIPGLAPVIYTEMNGKQFFKYNISAKVSSGQFFNNGINKQRTLTAFQNILNAICIADDYMIEHNCFSLIPEHVFLNVSNCEAALICIPVVTDKDINTEIIEAVRSIILSTQFDSSEDIGYITQIISYVNNKAGFNVYGMRDLIVKLQSEPSVPQPQVQSVQPMVQSMSTQPPINVPSFDSTISIEDMPAMLEKKHQMQEAEVQSLVQTPLVYTPPIQKPQPQVQRPQPAIPQPHVPKTPVQNGPGFAIPGQSTRMPATPPMMQPAPPATLPKSVEKNNGDKKMTLFNLLSNYNKENAELYKQQKAEAKKEKEKNAPVKAPKAPKESKKAAKAQSANVSPAVPIAPQVPPQPQYQPINPVPIQPIPVQNSFNETTVLSPAMIGGETTVLNAAPSVTYPYLTRIKTGERVEINKPIFRIGKEKSYVDYFIGDNTAISRSHANIHSDNGEYFIEDTNSTNHTYINGQLINSSVKTKLKSGDKVKLANEEFTFSI